MNQKKEVIVRFKIDDVEYIELIPNFIHAWEYDVDERQTMRGEEWGKLFIEEVSIRFLAGL